MNLMYTLLVAVAVYSPIAYSRIVDYKHYTSSRSGEPYITGEKVILTEDELEDIEMRQFELLPDLISDPSVVSVSRLSGRSGSVLGHGSFGMITDDELREVVSSNSVRNVYRMTTPMPSVSTTVAGSRYLSSGGSLGRTMYDVDLDPTFTYISERGVGGHETVDQFLDVSTPYVERSFNTYAHGEPFDMADFLVDNSVAEVDSMLSSAQVIQVPMMMPQPQMPMMMPQPQMPMMPPVFPRPPMMGGSTSCSGGGGGGGGCGGGCGCEPEVIIEYQPVPVPYTVPYPVASAPIVIEQEEPPIIITTTTTPAPVVTTTQVIVKEMIMTPKQTQVDTMRRVSEAGTTVRVLEPAVSTTIMQPTTTFSPMYQMTTAMVPSYQPMSMCIPSGGQLGSVQNMLTQALTQQSLPSQYEVLYASQAVGDQVNCRLALQVANNVCRSFNLMSPIGQNQWTLGGSSPIACPPQVPMQLPICPPGAF